MANLPQSEKLKKLNLVMHQCGRLYSAKPGAFCSRCGPDKLEMKTCKRGHVRATTEKRCKECDKARRRPAAQTEPFEDAAPVISDKQRAGNRAAAEERAARRAGLGRPDALALPL